MNFVLPALLACFAFTKPCECISQSKKIFSKPCYSFLTIPPLDVLTPNGCYLQEIVRTGNSGGDIITTVRVIHHFPYYLSNSVLVLNALNEPF